MPTLFESARDWLPEQIHAAAGCTLTITRGAERTESVSATVGRVGFRSDADGGVWIQVGDRDYLIQAANYLIAGVAVVPAIGDRFQEDGSDDVWELQDPGNGDKPWRWSDPQRTRYRVHTKKVQAAG